MLQEPAMPREANAPNAATPYNCTQKRNHQDLQIPQHELNVLN